MRHPDASKSKRTPAEWRRTHKRVLLEIDRYLTANVETDDLHLQMLQSGLLAADEALKDDFWPAYMEGLTRLLLVPWMTIQIIESDGRAARNRTL